MYKFINPYNFVPLGEDLTEKSRKDKEEVYRGRRQTELLSGWMEVKVHTKTPLIIPDTVHPKYYDTRREKYVRSRNEADGKDLHQEYDFLKLYNPEKREKEYAIPGSELRGMIRSTYEAATNSCMPFLLSDNPMSQRVPLYGAFRKRGLFGYQKGEGGNNECWVLYSAVKELEEVVVVPVYKVNGQYYAESLNRVRKNQENNKKDEKGHHKYKIMDALDTIENNLRLQKWENHNIQCDVVFKKQNGEKKWDIEVEERTEVKSVKKGDPVGYIFMRADGSRVEEKTASYIKNRGWLQYNVPVDTSRIYHIAYLKKDQVVHKWLISSEDKEQKTQDPYKALLSALSRDGARGKNTNADSNIALKKALEKVVKEESTENSESLVPVYYINVKTAKEEELFYMSGSAAGRIAQRRKWNEIFAGHTPCGNKLCPACQLFGTTADGGMKSHVRVSDAYIEKPEKAKTETHILQILSAPRTTAFEFYLRRPDKKATYWNFDFYGVTEKTGSKGASHTEYRHLEKAAPRGRKMYWHHLPSPDAEKKTNQNSTQQSIGNASFKFKVYFDQITKEQLEDLAWTITLGENTENSKRMHKLGHAKPLGYGSVKLIITGGKIRSFDRSEQNGSYYKFNTSELKNILDYSDLINPTFDLNSDYVQKLIKMSTFNVTEDIQNANVDYPRLRPNGNIYEWFAKNRTSPESLQVLPEPLDEDLSLSGNKDSKKRMDVRITKVKPDNKNPSKIVGFFQNGIVFDLDPSVRAGDTVHIIVKSKKDGRIFGNMEKSRN